MPNRKEHDSLIDLGQDNPAKPDGCPLIGAVFPYWSATSLSANDVFAWAVDFTFGISEYDEKDEEHWVRCVRGGQ